MEIPGLETGSSHFLVRELPDNSIESGLLAQISVETSLNDAYQTDAGSESDSHTRTEVLIQGMYIAYRHSQPFLETVIETISHIIRALHPMYGSLKAKEVHRPPQSTSDNKLVLQVYFASAAVCVSFLSFRIALSKLDS